SLRCSEPGVSEPSPGVPRYASAVYLDGNLVARYDSDTGKVVPWVDWMDQQYWEEQTKLQQRTQKVNGGSLDIL
ncbi:HA1F protein, partial [Trogon melanurus]|nr:HA1F protein [Trogon melanurus]